MTRNAPARRAVQLSSVPAESILVVDDLAATRDLLSAILRQDGYRVVVADDGRQVFDLVRSEAPDLVLMDVLMPEVDGFAACRALKSHPATRLVPVVLITGLNDSESRIRGIDAGADDFLTKPFHLAELRARVRSLVRIKRYTDDLDSAEAAFMTLAMTIEARDPLTNGHCQRMATYAAKLGGAIGLGEDELRALRRGGFLHDIGKVGVPDAVLLKPGPLTRDEYQTMQQHTVIGDRVCSELRSLRAVRPIVRSHHERLDGTGYPDGLRGDAVPLLAQIVGIVDVFDALIVARPYRPAMPVEAAVDELRREVDRGWRDRELVDTWITFRSEISA